MPHFLVHIVLHGAKKGEAIKVEQALHAEGLTEQARLIDERGLAPTVVAPHSDKPPYGPGVAPEYRSDTKLKTVLKDAGVDTLDQYRKKR